MTSTAPAKDTGIKLICQNRKAYHDFHIEETFEAGVMLTGTEVKSLRAGKANLKDSYARIINEEAFLLNVHISHYLQADGFVRIDPERTRKLLLHKKEIARLQGKVREKGYTIIPTKLYFKGGRAKVELALAKGKTSYDKRDSLKKKDAQKEMARAVKVRKKE
ncbi:MAG: SsrA-binding protein SmpB [Deltaproteobacteria bacterium]|nr:SsrA-binding protein SmpB [Deltaproteobacteria bacterium]